MPLASLDPGEAPLDPNVHPLGNTSPEWQPPMQPTVQHERAAKQPFSTKPGDAVPVFQRASSEWSPGSFAPGSSPVQIIRRVVGRVSVTLEVPSTASFGVAIGSDPGPLSEYQSSGLLGVGVWLMYPGDSVTIPTEAPVWAVCQNGQTTGTVQYFDCFNPAVLSPFAES